MAKIHDPHNSALASLDDRIATAEPDQAQELLLVRSWLTELHDAARQRDHDRWKDRIYTILRPIFSFGVVLTGTYLAVRDHYFFSALLIGVGIFWIAPAITKRIMERVFGIDFND